MRLYVTLSGMAASNEFKVCVNNGTFTEGNVTYSNAPKTGKEVGSYTVSNANPAVYGGVYDWITVELDPSCIAGDGTVSFTLVATGGDRVNFSSRQLSGECPILEIDYGEPVTSIELTDKEIDRPGMTVNLEAVVAPATNHQAITYTSSDSTIATVDANGVVTGISAGRVTITATSGTVSATCVVTVNNYVNLTSFVLNKTELTLAPTESETLTMGTCVPDNANWGMELVWESSDPTVAYVAADGTVLGRLPGTATITASSKKFPAVKATCTVTVQAAEHTLVFTPTQDAAVETHIVSTPGKGTGLYLYGNPKRYSVLEFNVTDLPSAAVGVKLRVYVTHFMGKAANVVRVYMASDQQWDEATVNKDNAPVQTGTYIGSYSVASTALNSWIDIAINKSVVQENGKVTLVLALNSGTGVYFSSKEGVYQPLLMVDYGAAITNISLSDMQATAGLTYRLVPQVTPSENHEMLYYSSSDEAVATIDENGMVKALGAGTATITVRNTAGTVSATCTVTVSAVPENQQMLSPVLDATLNGSGAGTNYGTSNNLHTIKSSNMHFLIVFDLSAVEGNVTKLTLRMQLNNVGAPSQTLGLYYAPTTAIAENAVKYNTWNGNYGEKIMEYVVSGKSSGDFLEIEIDPAVLANITDGKLGIVFKLEDDNPDTARCSFWSKEEKNNVKPMLIVETEPSGGVTSDPAPETEETV